MKLGDIVVFESAFRGERYVGRIRQVHIDNKGCVFMPKIRSASLEEVERFKESGLDELVLGKLVTYGKVVSLFD